MASNDDSDDYHPSLEPVVIINDREDDPQNEKKAKENFLSMSSGDNTSHSNISMYSNSKKHGNANSPTFEREYSPSKDDTKVQSTLRSHHITRSPRTQVRLISKDEADSASDTYSRRKSLPLEKCPICKKFFRRMKTHLLKHEMANRDTTDPLTCNICTKAFNTPSNLQIHMRTHTGDKPYACDVCSKAFSQSCNLVNHMRTHTGEKPFKCPHCDRAFTQSGNLNNHIRLHTDEKPFKCHFCDKAFVQSGNLNSHIKNNHKFVDNLTNEMIDRMSS